MWAVASTESFGPHSSADPAQGYIDRSQERVRVPLCFQDFTVQALDVQSGTVSSLVEVHATCSVAAQ
ncbi:hypothetical protein Q8G46_27695, partial [Klebsiella pneumoniae]|uniref:hypothetical protein n=1 Tax=Klebsiella pneumoniae TaxID=573 RepID=UPI003013A80D